jgi:hypothetical protein
MGAEEQEGMRRRDVLSATQLFLVLFSVFVLFCFVFFLLFLTLFITFSLGLILFLPFGRCQSPPPGPSVPFLTPVPKASEQCIRDYVRRGILISLDRLPKLILLIIASACSYLFLDLKDFSQYSAPTM